MQVALPSGSNSHCPRCRRPGTAAVFLAGLLSGAGVSADWDVISQRDESAGQDTAVAYTRNDYGYTLEIYRDSVGAIRSRFTLPGGLYRLAERSCPTFQIDRGAPINRSINDASCLHTERWAEFVLGYVDENRVASSRLLAFMNGIDITFRFRLAEGGYRETRFSLLGSKRSMSAALGSNVTVTAP